MHDIRIDVSVRGVSIRVRNDEPVNDRFTLILTKHYGSPIHRIEVSRFFSARGEFLRRTKAPLFPSLLYLFS